MTRGEGVEQPPCLPTLNDPQQGFLAGNIVEPFYNLAEVDAVVIPAPILPVRVTAICAVEAAGGVGAVPDSVSHISFVRLRNLPAGEYTVTTPCAAFTRVIVAPDHREEVVVTGVSGDSPAFSGALPGSVQLFAGNGTGAAGFLGDGITPGPLTGPLFEGGPTSFTLTGPNDFNFSTNQFVVVAKVFALAPVGAKGKVTFSRNSVGGGSIDFRLPKSPGAVSVEAVGIGVPLPSEPIPLTLSNGAFRASEPITADDVLPETVAVTFNLDAVGQTVEIFPLVKASSMPFFLHIRKENKQ